MVVTIRCDTLLYLLGMVAQHDHVSNDVGIDLCLIIDGMAGYGLLHPFTRCLRAGYDRRVQLGLGECRISRHRQARIPWVTPNLLGIEAFTRIGCQQFRDEILTIG